MTFTHLLRIPPISGTRQSSTLPEKDWIVIFNQPVPCQLAFNRIIQSNSQAGHC